MSGFPHAPPAADDYHQLTTERVHGYAWSAVGLLVIAGCTMVLALAIAYGSALGPNLSSLCFDVAPPDGYAPESLRERRSSAWPLGSDCAFSDRGAGEAVVPEEDWTATYVALGAGALGVGGVATGLAALRARTSGMQASRPCAVSNARRPHDRCGGPMCDWDWPETIAFGRVSRRRRRSRAIGRTRL